MAQQQQKRRWNANNKSQHSKKASHDSNKRFKGPSAGEHAKKLSPEQMQKLGLHISDGKPCSVQEPIVGITEFRYPSFPIHGTFKERYSDFLVREVNPEGRVVKLTELYKDPSKTGSKSWLLNDLFKKGIEPWLYQPNLSPAGKIILAWVRAGLQTKFTTAQRWLHSAQVDKVLASEALAIGAEKLQEIKSMLRSSNANEEVVISGKSKTYRTRIIKLVKQSELGLAVDSFTPLGETDAMVRDIRIRRDPNMGGKVKKNDRDRPQHPKYLEFVLYKANRDTISAVSALSKTTRTPLKRFSYAGTKDKRGITTQLCRVEHMDMHQLAGVNKKGTKRSAVVPAFNTGVNENLVVGNFRYTNDGPLSLGQLSGNQFSLVLRNVSLPGKNEETPDRTSETLRDHLTERMKQLSQDGFINYFGLQRFGTSSLPTHEMGKYFLQQNWSGAVDCILRPREGESSFVHYVRQEYQRTKDPAFARSNLPHWLEAERAVLSLLVDAKDSVSPRAQLEQVPVKLRMMYTHAYQSFLWNTITSFRLSTFGFQPIVGDLVLVGKKQVKVITAQDIELGTYGIEDIVLPVPGYQVQYPDIPEIKTIVEALLAKDKISFFKPKEAQHFRELDLPGDYRKIVTVPKHVSYSFRQYADETLPLVETDLHQLYDQPLKKTSEDEGPYTALVVQFELGSSSYATMLIRELFQSTSNIQHQLQHNTGTHSDALSVSASLGE